MKREIEGLHFLSVFYVLYMIFSFFPGGLENRNRLMHGGISYVHIYGIVTSLIQIFFKATLTDTLKNGIFLRDYVSHYCVLKVFIF